MRCLKNTSPAKTLVDKGVLEDLVRCRVCFVHIILVHRDAETQSFLNTENTKETEVSCFFSVFRVQRIRERDLYDLSEIKERRKRYFLSKNSDVSRENLLFDKKTHIVRKIRKNTFIV